MKTIYKYLIEINDEIEIELPKGAEILVAGKQGETAQLWAIVDTDNPIEKRTFAIIGTGNPFWPIHYKYINTFTDRVFVWHLFEIRPALEYLTDNP